MGGIGRGANILSSLFLGGRGVRGRFEWVFYESANFSSSLHRRGVLQVGGDGGHVEAGTILFFLLLLPICIIGNRSSGERCLGGILSGLRRVGSTACGMRDRI